MKAMVLHREALVAPGAKFLELVDAPLPQPGSEEVLIQVEVCGVCHTELDEIEGRTPPPVYPMILGHQVVGTVVERGVNAMEIAIGTRVGVAWIFSACGECAFCANGQENLCPDFQATGRDRAGGYAEFLVAPAAFVTTLPEALPSSSVAPLLCAGAIGYRSLRLTNLQDGQPLGFTGFGSSAQLALRMAQHRYPHSEFYVFARSPQEQSLARARGAVWAGDTDERSPEALSAIIDTTPVWTPVVEALRNLSPGGRLVINAIRKEDADRAALATIDYATQLWLEGEIKSVANVTRRDVADALALAAELGLAPQVQQYKLEDANQALIDLKTKPVVHSKVLVIGS
jgi:propanol-preferring alcohol dehydrogenase